MTRWPMSLLLALALAGCGRQGQETVAATQAHDVVVLDESLQHLKDDFNAASQQTRLLFIVGPTCGICLRGMADIDDALLAGNHDPRLATFVVHVPVLGAEEKHVAPTMGLITGGNPRHYWDASGTSGRQFSATLGIGDTYAWDMWMIYPPGPTWIGDTPPKPAYTMHQLPGLTKAYGIPFLDAKRFAIEAQRLLASMPDVEASSPQLGTAAADVRLDRIAQPVSMAVSQYIHALGGYSNLKQVTARRWIGYREVGERRTALEIRDARPNLREVNLLDASGHRIEQPAAEIAGIPADIAAELQRGFEFDGPVIEWKDKGHRISDRLRMARMPAGLAWVFDLMVADESTWRYYVDSGNGRLIKRELLRNGTDVRLTIEYADYREIAAPTLTTAVSVEVRGKMQPLEHFVMPYRIAYRAADGQIYAVDRFESIELECCTPDA